MKKSNIIFALIITLGVLQFNLIANAKSDKTLHHYFHHVKNLHTFKMGDGSIEYDFMKHGHFVKAIVDPSGNLIETDYSLEIKNLPEMIKAKIIQHFDHATIVNITKVVYQSNYFYKVDLESGSFAYFLAITPEGNVTIGY